MTNINNIEQLKKEHEKLYDLAIKHGGEIENKKNYLNEVNRLIKAIEKISASTGSFDDYRWLSDISIKWQVAFSSYFNLPKTIHISLPAKKLPYQKFPYDRTFSEQEVEDIIRKHAEYAAYWRIRELGRNSTSEEIDRDRETAEEAFTSEIIDGKINFAARISPLSFWRLEKIWLRDVKILNSFFIYQKHGLKMESNNPDANYLEASENLRKLLVNKGIKAMPNEFEGIRHYLLRRYLDKKGKLDASKTETKLLISRKASRLAQKDNEQGKVTDDIQNWIDAETYIEMFYENILPAIDSNDHNAILSILKAFQFSKSLDDHYHVINCFETTIAIYFINPDVIKKLWEDSSIHPDPKTTLETIVANVQFPKTFSTPNNLSHKFFLEGDKLLFKGVMTKDEKQLLIKHLKTYDSISENSLQALEQLFIQSRLIHRETTF